MSSLQIFAENCTKRSVQCCAGLGCPEHDSKPNIHEGDLRIRVYQTNSDDKGASKNYHPSCFFKFALPRAKTWALDGVDQLEGYSDLTGEEKSQITTLMSEGPAEKPMPKAKASKSKSTKAKSSKGTPPSKKKKATSSK